MGIFDRAKDVYAGAARSDAEKPAEAVEPVEPVEPASSSEPPEPTADWEPDSSG